MHNDNLDGTNIIKNDIISSLSSFTDLDIGCLSKLKHNLATLRYKDTKYEALIFAIKYKDLNIVKCVCENEIIKDINCNLYLLLIIDIAKKFKSLPIISYAIDFFVRNMLINYQNFNYNNYYIDYERDNYKAKYNRLINNKLMLETVKYASIDAIQKLFKLPLAFVDPNFNNNLALKKATIRGNLQIFIYLFQLALFKNKHPRSNLLPKYTIRKIYRLASTHGHVNIIKYLLKYPDPKEIKKIDIQIVSIILKEIASRPFVENKMTHIECYDLIRYLLNNNLHRISVDDLLVIADKIKAKVNHLNYDKPKSSLFFEYIYKAINIQMIAVCAMFLKKAIPIESVGYHIATYLYKEKISSNMGYGVGPHNLSNTNNSGILNKNFQILYYIKNQLVEKSEYKQVINKDSQNVRDLNSNNSEQVNIKLTEEKLYAPNKFKF